MIGKIVLAVCAQALLAQCIISQYIGAYNGELAWEGAPWGAPVAPWNAGPYIAEAPLAAAWSGAPCAGAAFVEWGPGLAPATLAAATGGSFPIASFSPIPVTGVSMTSENVYEGTLSVSGAMPFLGAVALEGVLPTIGAGAVTYGCGNGNVAMLTEDMAAGPYGYAPGIAAADLEYGYGAPFGYEAGFAGPAYGYNAGYGCGAYY